MKNASVEVIAQEAWRKRTPIHIVQYRLPTPVSTLSLLVGFWVLHLQSYTALANEMEMAKAIQYLSGKEFDQAIEVLKGFERKEQHLKARASTNLSFLYFLEGDLNNAEKYAEMGVQNDRCITGADN